jgi:hypothetical protein
MVEGEHARSSIQIAKKQMAQAQDLGGLDIDFELYDQSDISGYADKGSHLKRSIGNSEQHRKHFKKEGVIYEH